MCGSGGRFVLHGPQAMPQPVPNGANSLAGSVTTPLKEVTKIRSNFPETWLWTNETIGYIFYFKYSMFKMLFKFVHIRFTQTKSLTFHVKVARYVLNRVFPCQFDT